MTNIYLVSIYCKHFCYDKVVARVANDKHIVRSRQERTQDDKRRHLVPVICDKESKDRIEYEWKDIVDLIGWHEYEKEEDIPKEWFARDVVQAGE